MYVHNLNKLLFRQIQTFARHQKLGIHYTTHKIMLLVAENICMPSVQNIFLIKGDLFSPSADFLQIFALL